MYRLFSTVQAIILDIDNVRWTGTLITCILYDFVDIANEKSLNIVIRILD